jgi:gamma-polyglutamate synthase
MGVQNIKGTGLDFAYRFIAYQRTVALAGRLETATGAAAAALAAELARCDDTGILDGPVALGALAAAALRAEGDTAQALAAAARAITERQRRCQDALGRTGGRRGVLRRVVAGVLDVYDGVWRRRRADQIVDELARGHLGHERAARELRDLMKRQKGGKG